MWIDETNPSANRGSLVQVDAHRDNVALTRAVRVPDVRAAVSGVLGTSFNGHAERDGIAARDGGRKRLVKGN